MDRVSQLEEIQLACKEIFRKKNADYGDAFATYGTVGVLVRIGDKLARFSNISSKKIDYDALNKSILKDVSEKIVDKAVKKD